MNISSYWKSPNDNHAYFFGYYDKNPLSNNILLAHRANFDGRLFEKEDKVDIGYFDLKGNSNNFNYLTSTYSCNWQTGSMLTWINFKNKKNCIAYLDYKDGKYITRIIDIEGNFIDEIPYAINSISLNSSKICCIDAQQYDNVRPSYRFYATDIFEGYKTKYGIIIFDTLLNRIENKISFSEIKEKISTEKRIDKEWIEHSLINTSGTKTVFMYRYKKVNSKKTFTKILVLEHSNLEIIELPESSFYSHLYWQTDDKLSAWTTFPNDLKNWKYNTKTEKINLNKSTSKFKKLLNMIYKKRNIISKIIDITKLRFLYNYMKNLFPEFGYKISNPSKLFFFDVDLKIFEDSNIDKFISPNGHQSFLDENTLLIDTYEDENKYRNLYFYSLSNDNLNRIGKFYSEYNDVGYRCDLHPRLCKKENNEFIISIDCCSSIKRHMELIKVKIDG